MFKYIIAVVLMVGAYFLGGATVTPETKIVEVVQVVPKVETVTETVVETETVFVTETETVVEANKELYSAGVEDGLVAFCDFLGGTAESGICDTGDVVCSWVSMNEGECTIDTEREFEEVVTTVEEDKVLDSTDTN